MNNDDIKLGTNHIWLPYTQMLNHLPQLEVEKTKGSKIYLKNGKILIDGISSWWAVSHGYNHPHIIKNLIKQAKKLPHIMLAGFANDATYQLSHRLAKFCEMDKVFFSDSGSTSIEVAMKMAWQYHFNCGNIERKKFVSFKNSYHGDTTGAMSLADLQSGMHQKFSELLLRNYCLDLPKNLEDFEFFENFLAQKKSEIAGIFIEPIVQCAGGMKFHSPKILENIFEIAKKYDILTIVDECATGFYRTGKKFAFMHTKYHPDILTVGKALTGGVVGLSATLTSNKIYEKFLDNSLDKALMHGPTFMGNALACACANASLDLFENEDYQKKVAKIEKIIQKNLKKLKNFIKVKEVRAIGAIGVIEIDTNWEEIKILRQKFIEKGVFLRPFGNVIYIMPPLNISSKDLALIFKAVEKILKEIE
jgi:adenosylmethionine-8-amino-7-oxononanoate aminotransferase